LGQNLTPCVFGAREDSADKLFLFIRWLSSLISRRGLYLLLLLALTLKKLPRVAAEQTNYRSKDEHAYASTTQCNTASHSATIFNVRALSLVSPAHSFPDSSPARMLTTNVKKSVIEFYHFPYLS
jgi:hypothetical protein